MAWSGRSRNGGTLVPDKDRWLSGRPKNEQRLLKARIESGQKRQVGTVLTIGIHDDAVIAALVGELSQTRHPGGVEWCRDFRRRVGHAEVGQTDPHQA